MSHGGSSRSEPNQPRNALVGGGRFALESGCRSSSWPAQPLFTTVQEISTPAATPARKIVRLWQSHNRRRWDLEKGCATHRRARPVRVRVHQRGLSASRGADHVRVRGSPHVPKLVCRKARPHPARRRRARHHPRATLLGGRASAELPGAVTLAQGFPDDPLGKMEVRPATSAGRYQRRDGHPWPRHGFRDVSGRTQNRSRVFAPR